MKLILRLLLSIAVVMGLAALLPAIHVRDAFSAFFLVIVLSVLNFLLKPVLIVLTIPVTIMTFGLFLLVINAIIVLIADVLVPGFGVTNFWWALLFSIIISFANSIIDSILKDKE